MRMSTLVSGLSLSGSLLWCGVAMAQDVRIPQSRDRSSEFVGFVQPNTLHLRPLIFPGLPVAEFKQRMRQFCSSRLIAYKIPARVRIAEGPLHSHRFKRQRNTA